MTVTIEQVAPDAASAEAAAPLVQALAEVLHGCVQDGASVGFVLPFPMAAAAGFWRGVLAEVARGDRLLLVARLDGRIVGTAQVVPAGMPNGRHRAEVAKVLVHPQARRQGIARRLMLAAEALARRQGRRLLVLDTTTGSGAEHLYAGLGYAAIGVVPAYAAAPDGTLHPTTIMAKELADAD